MSTSDCSPMHLALYLPEILYNIFGHVVPVEDWEWAQERLPHTSDLAALARTCRAFKEPALDVLWSELPDLSALARCVPDATHSEKRCHYAFKRPLTDVEWATLRSYSRRVWIFLNCIIMEACLDEESITMLFSPSPDALFPNLRFLSWNYGRTFPLVHVAARPLRVLHLDLRRADIPQYRNILDSAGTLCPYINKFRLYLPRQYVELDNIISNHVLRWSNIRFLECREVALNADAILHISCMSALTHLSFVLSEELPGKILPSDFVLVFSNLSWCEIASGWLSSVANLFARTRLPAIKELTVRFPGSPSKQTLRSFMTTLRNACSSDTLTHLTILSQHYLFRRLSASGEVESDSHPLAYDDLYPCMTLGNLRSLKINLNQAVSLTDNDLVELASAWPHLEELLINHDLGWRSPDGITLHGLVRLLRTCPALRNFSILLDTPTFVHVPEGMDVSYPPRHFERVNLVDSPLEAEMVAGVVDVFVAIRFSPRLLFARMRFETNVDMAGNVPATRQSWRDVDTEVKIRLGARKSKEDEDVLEI